MAWRLYVLLPGEKRVAAVLKAVIIGIGYNNILPAKAGEILKIMYLSRNLDMPVADTGAVVFWERLFDILLLFVLSIVLGCLGFKAIPLAVPVSITFLVVVGFFLVKWYSGSLHGWYKKIPFVRLADFMDKLHFRLTDAVSLGWTIRGTYTTLIIWLISLGSHAIALIFVAGLDISLFQTAIVFMVASFGSAIPSSPGSLGVYEAAIVYSLSLFGIGKEESLGIAFFLRLILFLPITVTAIILGQKALDR
jgi:uncharacterized protein (TIRG00374 family)